MPKLRRLSGAEVVGIFEQLGFVIYAQRGSIKIAADRFCRGKTNLNHPAHQELDTAPCGHYSPGRPIHF
jgi:predicted RNA binding protein YcfA (HicA-like mRNA interferase family)